MNSFKYRSVSFGTPVKDGPPDPTGVRVTGNPVKDFRFSLDRDLLALASRLGFNDITIQTEGRMEGLAEAVRDWAERTGNFRYIRGLGMTISIWIRELQDHPAILGKLSLDNEPFWRSLKKRYRLILNEVLPEIDFLILTVVESEIKLTGDAEVLARLVRLVYEECRNAGKRLIFRTFVWFPEEMAVVQRAVNSFPREVIIQSKCVPQDWHLRGVHNPMIGNVGGRAQYVEFDIAGEYNKLTNVACAFTDILEHRLQYAEAKGCNGISVRVDRYRNSVYGQAQEANLWFLGLRTSGECRDADEIWRRYTVETFGERAAPLMEAALRPTGEVIAEAMCVERESYGYSRDYRPAGRNMENPFDVYHSPARWDPGCRDTYNKIIAGDPEIISSKERSYADALESARTSLSLIDSVKALLPDGAYPFFRWKLEENLFHLNMFCNMELAWLKATRRKHSGDPSEREELLRQVEDHLDRIETEYRTQISRMLRVVWRGRRHQHSRGSYHDWNSWMESFCRYAEVKRRQLVLR